MEASRNRLRSRFLGCFRPFHDHKSFSRSSSSSLQTDAADGNRRRLRRSLSAALKAVIFKSASVKKSHSEKSEEKGLRYNILSTAKRFVKSAKQSKHRVEDDEVSWSSQSPLLSSNSSSPSSSSASSTTSSSSQCSPARSDIDTIQRAISPDQHLKRIKTTKSKHKRTKQDRKRIPCIEACVLVVCLFALIWGKTFAVVSCTSALLFFAPSPSSQSPKLRRRTSLDSEEHKKRVIMQGWLERDHRTRF